MEGSRETDTCIGYFLSSSLA